MDSLDAWLGTMFLFCSANTYDPERLKAYLGGAPKRAGGFQERFAVVLRDRPLRIGDWERHMGLDFDSTDDLYAHLRAVYDFLFETGPFPEPIR